MTIHKKSYHLRFIFLGIFILVLILLYYLGYFEKLSQENLKAYALATKEFVQEYYWHVVLGFIGSLSTAVALSIPLGIIIPIIGGFLFGWLPGALYAIIGATLGATASFLIARYFLGDFIHERYEERLHSFNEELRKYGYLYLLGLHFFPITPFFILNILAAMTRLALFTFVWTTIVGVTPAYLIYSYIGSKLININTLTDLASKELVIAFILLKSLSAITLIIGRFGYRLKKK